MLRDEILSHSFRPALGKHLIGFGAANALRVAMDDDGAFVDFRTGESECDAVELGKMHR